MIGNKLMQGEIVQFPGAHLSIGTLTMPNSVILAPMSGITDTPFRRLAERLGAGLVVSEMTAGAGLARGEREASLRSAGDGIAIPVVQLAGCEARWMGEGARIAEAEGAQIIDINMGCPSKQVTNGAAENAIGLGGQQPQRPRAGAPRASRRRADDHRAWAHPLPVL
jgi:hypothetical protein